MQVWGRATCSAFNQQNSKMLHSACNVGTHNLTLTPQPWLLVPAGAVGHSQWRRHVCANYSRGRGELVHGKPHAHFGLHPMP